MIGGDRNKVLPINAAFIILKTSKISATIGVGANFYETYSYFNNGTSQMITDYSKSTSLNYGLNIYRLFEFKKGRSMKLGLAGSYLNYRRTPDPNLRFNGPAILVSGIASWKYPVRHYHFQHYIIVGIINTSYEGRFIADDYYIAELTN